MKNIIKSYCENELSNGLFLMDLPTGFGKTHNVIQYIYEASLNPDNKDKKYFFITNLKKNLPEKQLRDLFEKNGKKKEFEEKFLYLNSNADIASDGFTKNPSIYDRVPKDIAAWEETKFFFQDLKDIVKQRRLRQNGEIDFSSSLECTFATKIEREFRHKVEMQLKSEFHKTEDRKTAVKKDERWNWLGDLYESTKTSEKQIIILSAKKFVTKNDTLVETPYLFYANKIMDGSVVFIDEFDATKSDFLDNIIDDGIREQIDFIDLFLNIHSFLQSKKFQKELWRKSNWYQGKKYGNKSVDSIVEGFKDASDEIFEKYNLSYDIRTHRDQDLSKNFLFQDNQYHAITNDNKLISVSLNENEFRNEIRITDEKINDSSVSIQMMLSKVRGFINFFQIGVKRLASNMFYYRAENHIDDGDFSYEAAVSSVLKQFRLKDLHIKFLKNQILQDIRKKGDSGFAKDFDLSFFAKGLRYYAFVNDIMNDLESVIMMFAFNNTPEKILLNTCERAKVIGISATATIPTVIGNFNLDYMKEQLGANFREMSQDDRNRLKDQFYSEQDGYKDVSIHAELLGSEARDNCDEKTWLNIYDDEELAKEAYCKVCDAVPQNDTGFHKERYYRIVLAYKKFIENDDIQSFLCILTTHPKNNQGSLHRNVLLELFSNLDPKAEEKVKWLTTEDFDENKRKISDELGKGEKRFVVSAYATLGAGQNLQYNIPARLMQNLVTVNGSRKGNEKDYDAIYLDNPTNLLVNINVDKLTQKDFVKFLFQIEYLQQHGEISSDLAMQHIRKGFDAFANQKQSFRKAGKISNRESIKLFATRSIIQAIGRICRTNRKSKNIYIFADSRIAENIDHRVTDNLILNHEFKTLLNIIEKKETPDIVYASLELQASNKSVDVNSFISAVMSKNEGSWTEINVERWKELRDFALKHPTISKEELNQSGKNSFYAELPSKSNILYFSQDYDFKKVTVSFEPGPDYPMVESAAKCKLDKFMSHPGIRQHFIENGYKTDFEPNDYIMVPTFWNNIYKGALGESVGWFIFSKWFDVKLEEITDLEAFELFDFKVPGKPYYVDFKHWSMGSDVEREKMIDKIAAKARKCDCTKVLVVNIMADSIFECKVYNASVEILAVPALLYDDGKMKANRKAEDSIRRFLV